MKSRDEPLLGAPDEPIPATGSEALVTSIRRLVTDEAHAVLCTQGESQPYGSIVAYAFGDDLSSATFATPITPVSSGCWSTVRRLRSWSTAVAAFRTT